MIVENVKVYDLEECIVASGYPMLEDLTSIQDDINNLKYWSSNSIFDLFVNNSEQVDNITINSNNATVYIQNDENNLNGFFDIDFIDIELFLKHKWHITNNGYLRNENGDLLHRLIMNPSDNECVDHIDRNKHNNIRSNYRICSRQENTMNSGLSKNNNSGVTGVSYREDKKCWRAYIFYNGKQINLGHFKNKDEAIVVRLLAEKEYFKEFAPQIQLFNKYGIEYSEQEIQFKYANLSKALKHFKRMVTLGNTKKGEGHDQALTGIRVNFDLTFTNKAWVELERYRFVEFVSSQSTMHRLAKMDLSKQYNEYVDSRIIAIMEELKEKYNNTQNKEDYLRLLYSNPAGFKLTARLTTNYRALKTVYSQRKNHRLPEWQEFCKWILTLPYFKELCLGDKV